MKAADSKIVKNEPSHKVIIGDYLPSITSEITLQVHKEIVDT